MNLTLLRDVVTEPVSLTAAKNYLKQDVSDDDAIIGTLITAARLEAECEHGRELAVKQWKLVFDRFPTGLYSGQYQTAPFFEYGLRPYTFGLNPGFIELLDPLVSVDFLKYKKADGTVVTMTEDTDYVVDTDKHPGVVCPASGTTWPDLDLWPSSAVQITFTAGYAEATCPGHLQQGILLLVNQWYNGRIPFEAIRFIAELPFSVTSLFRNNKLWKF